MPSETCEAVENYLKDVDEQISCKIGLDLVNRELRGHIEDKASLYMEYGMEEKEAYRRSVRDMGAADVVGMELNKHHRLRTAAPLLALILVLMAVGAAGELLRDGGVHGILDAVRELIGMKDYLWGLLVLFLVMRFGYPFLLKHTRGICICFLAVCIAVGGFYLSNRLFPGWSFEALDGRGRMPDLVFRLLWSLSNSTVFVGMVQLAVPTGTVLLFRRKDRNFQGVVLLFVYQALFVAIASANYWDVRTYIPTLTLLFACFGVTLYFSGKGWFRVSKAQGTAAAFVSLLLLLVFWAAPRWGEVKENWKMCVHPGEQASVTTAWDDAYNNVLIRELLGRAKAFGTIELTEEELVRYGTSQWYYEDGPGKWENGRETDAVYGPLEQYVEVRMQHLEEPELRDILPQYYMENYRVSWWILQYGWIPALLLAALVLALPVLALWTAFRIKNRLGRAVAFSGGLIFAIQTVMYLTENFGFQFGYFSNLPFISEGIVSITGSAVLAGLILSAYRFDIVIDESAQEPGESHGKKAA